MGLRDGGSRRWRGGLEATEQPVTLIERSEKMIRMYANDTDVRADHGGHADLGGSVGVSRPHGHELVYEELRRTIVASFCVIRLHILGHF